MNGNKVNLLYWDINPYVYNALCDKDWNGPNEMFVKYVINSPWWEWSKSVDLEIWMDMNHLVLDDMYVYTAYAHMLPKDETFFRLKYEVLHLKNIVF